MTLTEEQRAALKRVVAYMDEMYSVASPYHGCTEDSDLLRAMIDSSGTVEPTGGFDLEKARAADEALPYPLDAKEIWISGKGQMHINPPNAQSIFFNLSDLCEVRNLFHGRAAEIEWLNEHINTACLESLRITDEQAKEIERLRKIIDSPPEEESWKADYDLLHQLDASGAVCVARKWHAAYRKAQNSNLLRKQEIERLRAENEEALESLTAAYLLGRHEKAQEVAARPKEDKIDSSEHVTEPTKMIGFDLEVRWHDDYMKRFSDITTWHCGHATLWIMHSSGKQEWIPLAAVRRISSVEASQ